MTGQPARIGLYARSEVLGGAERSMLTLANAYAGDHELVIVSPSPVVLEEAAAAVGSVERHLISLPGGALGDLRAHRQALRGLELDLLQVTLPSPFAARDVQMAAHSLRLPTIGVQQLVLPARRARGARLVRWFARPLAATIAVGGRTADDLVAFFGMDRSRIHVVHNGVPVPPPTRIELDDRPVVGFIGRYEEQKGIDRLIRAMAEVPEGRLLLVGDGSLRGDLERLCIELGVEDRVEVGPWRADTRDLVGAFDVFALASVDEAFPLTIGEAMLAGVPVVATNVGSVSEAVIDDETGLLVESGDHEALVAALRRLLTDDELAGRLAAAGRAHAEANFTDVAMAAGYERVWNSVLDR